METIDTILTEEERDILILGALHLDSKQITNREISQRLGISVTRVKTLIHQACVKLDARNRNEAIFNAIRRGDINLNELLSVDELAEILCSLDPDVLRDIALLVRHHRKRSVYPDNGRQIVSMNRKRPGILTNRERDVLILVSNGLTNMEIADRLCMSTSAVRMFLYRAFSKLGARKRADAVQLALKRREIFVSEISSLEELTFFLAPYGAESIEKMALLLDEKRKQEICSIHR